MGDGRFLAWLDAGPRGGRFDLSWDSGGQEKRRRRRGFTTLGTRSLAFSFFLWGIV